MPKTGPLIFHASFKGLAPSMQQNKNRSGVKCLKPDLPLPPDTLGGPAPYIYMYST